MEKTKLMAEAIEAFKVRYGELPADAGFPVVRELEGSVYFARSKGDWIGYAIAHYKYTAVLKAVLIFIVVATVTILSCCVGTHSLVPLAWGIVVYVVAMAVLYFVSFLIFRRDSRGEGILREYDGMRKKFYAIEI